VLWFLWASFDTIKDGGNPWWVELVLGAFNNTSDGDRSKRGGGIVGVEFTDDGGISADRISFGADRASAALFVGASVLFAAHRATSLLFSTASAAVFLRHF
jgi:hypothetical protein